MRVLLHVLVKELLQLRQDKRMIPAMVIGPLMQLLALGFAANTDVSDLGLLVVDLDRTPASRALIDRFTSSGYFDVAGSLDSVDGIEPWLVDDRAQVALVIGAGYAAEQEAGRTPEVQLLADGTDASSAVVGLGYASSIVAAEGAAIIERHLADLAREAERRGERPPQPGVATLVPRVWYNPDLRSRWFYVPAILALTLLLLTMILPSMAVVREKETGTLEQISVTPVRAWQIILGKLLPFAFVGLVDLFLVTLAARVVFGVPFRGSYALLVVLTAPFLLTTLGLGLLVSTMVRTQQQAMMTASFLLMVPMIYLSGLIFPIENMPPAIQWVTWAIPLRYYNDIIRGLFLKGSGIDTLWVQGVTLVCFGLAALALASLRFRKSLD